MSISNFRKISLEIGTSVGLYGDYNAVPLWGESILTGKIVDWVTIFKDEQQDTASLIQMPKSDSFIDAEGNVSAGDKLLLVLRYPDSKWDNRDPNVHVYALNSAMLEFQKISLSQKELWKYVVWLSSAAIMTVQDEGNLSAMAKTFREKNIPVYM